MKLPSITKVVKRIMRDPEQLSEDEKQAKLEEWKKRLQEAMEEHEIFRADCATCDALYGGTKQIRPLGGGDLYVSDRYRDDTTTPQPARQVVNLTFQLIESQIDVNLPVPAVEPTEEADSTERREMIEGQLAYMAADASMRRINTENERIVKKNGLAFFKVGWDPNYRSHVYRGRVETINPHPGNVVLQPGITRIKDMDYIFHIENRTIDYICRQYGEEFREQLESENLEYGQLDYFISDTAGYTNEKTKKVSIVEAWYKDKDGDIGLLTWVGDIILRDSPKFFYKRDAGGNLIEYDEIDVPEYDSVGNVIGSKSVMVKCHVPDQFPFVVWLNIPREKSPRGISDPFVVFDQQEGIKKLLSTEEEKQMKGTTKIFVRKGSGAENKITNSVSQIITTEDPVNDVVTKDLKTPDNALKDLYYIYVQAAKDALGITEASQGRTDRGKELSGRALEILAANTQGRLGVKAEEKDIAYTELYRMWYDFLLAFADHRIPYRTDGQYNKPVYGYWDKSKLIKQDDAGEWYYPEFDIFVQAESAMPKDKRFILDLASQAGNRIDNVEYWMLMESIGIPQASAILEMEQQKMQSQVASLGSQGLPQGLQPLPQQEGTPQGTPMLPGMDGVMPTMPEMPIASSGGPQGPMGGEIPQDNEMLVQIFRQLPQEIQEQILQMLPQQGMAFLMQAAQQFSQQQGSGMGPGQAPDQVQQIMAIIQQLPPEMQTEFIQLLQTNPEQAMAMLQQVIGGQPQI
jgi:hypothetical protein